MHFTFQELCKDALDHHSSCTIFDKQAIKHRTVQVDFQLSSFNTPLCKRPHHVVFNFGDFSINPICPGGGGGGLRGPDDQTHSCQSETYYSMMPKLGDF